MGQRIAFDSASHPPSRILEQGTERKDNPMYNLNERRISPAALLRPNDLVSRTHRKARMAAILRDERFQLNTDASGRLEARLVRSA